MQLCWYDSELASDSNFRKKKDVKKRQSSNQNSKSHFQKD